MITFYLDNGILFGTMYIWIFENCFLSACKNVTFALGWLASTVFISKIFCCVMPAIKIQKSHVKKVYPSKVDISKDVGKS